MRPRYRFLFTGFKSKNTDERAHLVNKIQTLGGIYYESEHFKLNCTHIVCARLCRSEKFLCACAAGKWIVTPEYIERSYEAKEWLKEEDFEWRISDLPVNANEALVDLCRAPKRGRQFVAWQYGKGQFYGKKFVVFIKESDNRDVYRRILLAGGAKVVTSTPPHFNLSLLKPAGEVKFVLVTENKSCLRPIFRANVLGVSTDYIRNYLLKKSPPQVSDFDITSYVPNSDIYFRVGLGNSPVKKVLTNPPKNSPFRKSSRLTACKKLEFSPKLVPIVIRENMEKKGGKILLKNNKQDEVSKNGKTQTSIRNFFGKNETKSEEKATKSEKNWKKRKSEEDINPAKRRVLAPIPNKAQNLVVKPEVVEKPETLPSKPEVDERLGSLLNELSKLEKICAQNEIERFRKRWEPKVAILDGKFVAKEYPVSCYIESCFVDEDWQLTLMNFNRLITPTYFLPPKIIKTIINSILLNGSCEDASSVAFLFLGRVLRLLPPRNIFYRKWYCSVLEDNACLGSWGFVRRIIRESLSEDLTVQYSRGLFLCFLESLLEMDFALFIKGSKDIKKRLKSPLDQPIIVQILWHTKLDFSRNKTCSDLLKYLVLSIKNNSKYKMQLILSLQKITTLMFESARLSEAEDGVVNDIKYNSVSLIQKLAEHVKSEKLSFESLSLLFDTMELSWTRMLLAQTLIDSRSRCVGNMTKLPYSRLSLGKIVNFYMKVVPDDKNRAMESKNENLDKKLDNTAPVNRKNTKGETRLHTACINNKPEAVRKLLNTDINVNAVDNAGWTPLHEACNRGHMDCVRLLLDVRNIDLLARNDEDITPLHDAVVNNHMGVAKLLLERGGRVLLEQRDIYDRLPVNLAKSEDARLLLVNFKESPERMVDVKLVDEEVVEIHIILIFNLLEGYLETYKTQEIFKKLQGTSHDLDSAILHRVESREEIRFDDTKIFQQLDAHINAFKCHVKKLSSKNNPNLDLFNFILFQLCDSFSSV